MTKGPPVQVRNDEVQPAVDALISSTSVAWVLDSQDVSTNLSLWKGEWRTDPALPHLGTLELLENEIKRPGGDGNIRRRFIFDALAKDPIDLIIGSMIWGWGDDSRFKAGRKNARLALSDESRAVRSIGELEAAFAKGGTRAAYRRFFESDVRLDGVGVPFATKLLHFLGYQFKNLQGPRPLIYDANVAAALARFPSAPYVPAPARTRTDQYFRFCEWAEAHALARKTDPIVVEYALFRVGRNLGRGGKP
jgi:hypothetical protein